MARMHHQARVDQLGRTIEVAARSEAERPDRLERSLAHAAWYFEHQAERFEANVEGAQWYIERDFRRAERRLPHAADRAGEILYGKPENIEPTAILLFF